MGLYPSYFKLQMRWRRAFTPGTAGINEGPQPTAAFPQLELFRVSIPVILQVAYVLATLIPPSHIVIYAPGD
ncbi:hypothetical protein CWN52_04300 [Klebsiella michiganensis]|uniref:Uncharacterized protein n=1 Tax=Klebsiella michiganensis TaxID=1134687 RepID=A0A2J5Q6I9_9ENTR|nr:hypothetical protein C2U44_30130 [Klebsiella oxytoca]MBX4652037.1 hypothetical protein [Klebsiella michiganensis]PLO02653.1 hypothetical protein CWN52_04300 [Klebsiella michiganensis]PLO73595.1 hypothetical protein CWN49_05380 [Klebsiella michiganensis]PLP32246.1 hypothetical protein CWM92_05680 [Klebsiella michiganensis]